MVSLSHTSCSGACKRSPQGASQEQPPERSQCCSRIQTLLNDEAVFRSQSDQIAFETSSQSPQLSLWRDRVAQWYYNVVDHLNAPRDTVFLAMNFLDRTSALDNATRMITKEEYELLSTTCIFLALRVTSSRTDLSVADLLQVCESRLIVREIQDTGARLLQTLSLKTPMISPSTFAKAYLQLLPSVVSPEDSLSMLETSLYLIELSVCDHYLARVPASKLALAAVVACVKSSHAGPHVDYKTQDAFLKSLELETSMSLSSADIQPYYARLFANYNQSREGISTAAPVVILDEPDTSHPYRPQDSSESLISLLPWTPTVSDLGGLGMSRPSKRSRLC